MARIALAVASLAVGLGATWIGARGAGPLPPLGGALSPAIGLWANAMDDLPAEASGRILVLGAQVDVRYDQRSVPHIFATNELDAIRALGYVVARDRLFQIELQARAGEGTLTELVGNVALPADRETRGLGMPRSAERKLASLDSTGETMQFLRAYADGINAYRASLSPARYPAEYKLLNKAPREWLPVHSLHLFNRMGYTLAHAPVELDLLRAKALVGDSAARAIFDTDSPVQEPIQPAPRSMAREALTALPAPGVPDAAAAHMVTALGNGTRALFGWSRDPGATPEERAILAQERAFASNNWAVSPSRSANGTALLAGDPHLELTLPSIWYEVHMVVPGIFDVGGVTIPGLPGVVIGYTRALAWSFTNTGADVMDFWRETVDDAKRPTRYQLDGESVAFADTRVETYHGPKGDVIAIDTVYYTHRGPMQRVGNEWLSMRWTVLEAGEELMGFRAALHAQTATAFLDTMAVHYMAPAQNMIVGDTSGTIAIRSTGRFPIRADSGRGTEIREGNTRKNDWIGFRSIDRYPQSVNPAQGYLASANQQPIDPQDDPLYFGVDGHFEIWRALQINRLLRADSSMTADKMRRFHTDPGSVRADLLVPAFLHAADMRRAQGEGSPSLEAAETLLAKWDRRYTRDNTGSRLFEMSLSFTTALLYDELTPAGASQRVATPSESRLLQLVADSSNGWWDDKRTPNAREDRDRVLSTALAKAYDSLVTQYGDPAKQPWVWGTVSPARPQHLLKLEGFAAPPTPIDGGRGTLNPSVASRRANFGASWRMVVEFGKEPVIRATYPGGQSGNPGSTRYLDRLPLWASGTLDSVRTPRSLADLPASDVRAVLTLTR
ncbi:MAG TPA: penicillin acylase family protein [Gemmatimonas aurantiaca]|uniref:Penicillin amidase family protein n=2 Tax=Gemmatimonas aurantiaca TaxID=173480 RepID=C1AC63_GEMAT|nr:penicillin acylase family protein [Gemmatimonas aurantiaca]BAH40090.1 penicillin amidase family protein [Gemmatimonas aurantiaca T-27]HCT57902.1 penicillin acylase family protein [Gemmatimonas aurantiaca]